jgi:CheY-like chemotaxis protein
MPEMNGYELVQRLRAAGHDKLPIIAVTGYGLEDDRNKAIQAGFTSHLTKPIGTRELHQILQGALV